MKRPFDPRLYLVTDRSAAAGRRIEDVVEAAVRGGVTAVQLRDKDADDEALAETAARLIERLAPSGVLLIINDRVEAALRAGAAGVHLGQGDVSPGEARRILGPRAVIGLSVETLSQALAAAGLDIDYLGVSPVFATPTKLDAGPAWGLHGLRALRAATDLPLVAIGGINAENAASVLAAGADGLAVVSAIMGAADPEAAARVLRRIVEAAPRRA